MIFKVYNTVLKFQLFFFLFYYRNVVVRKVGQYNKKNRVSTQFTKSIVRVTPQVFYGFYGYTITIRNNVINNRPHYNNNTYSIQ